jgi:hypothetical protein
MGADVRCTLTPPALTIPKRTVSLCLDRAQELDIRHIVVASNEGVTAQEFIRQARARGLQLYRAAPGTDVATVPQGMLNLVVVTHQVGHREPGVDENAGGGAPKPLG